MDYLIILSRTLLSYSILVLSLRIMGKREIGQLSLFDLVILLSIADIIVVGIENFNKNYFQFLLPVIVLTLLQKIVAFIMLRSTKMRTLMDGKPSIIILNGVINKAEMVKQSYNIDDLLLQLRNQNIFNFEDVFCAILETNGNLSVLKKSENIDVFPLPIIISGKIDYEILHKTGKSKEWLTRELGKNRLDKNDILCAFVKNDELIWV